MSEEWLSPSSGAVFLPPEMIVQMALGIEPMEEIAARFGYDKTTYDLLFQQVWFQHKVDAKRTELRETGLTLRAKAAVMAEDLMTEVYVKAKGEKVGVDSVLAAAKFMAEMGDVKPKGENGGGGGERFSIIINAGGAPVQVTAKGPAPQDEVIEGQATMVIPRMIAPAKAEGLGPPPGFAAATMNRDLIGEIDLDEIDDLLPEPA